MVSQLEEKLKKDYEIFSQLFGINNGVNCREVYQKIALLIENYTQNLSSEPVYFEFGQSNFRFNNKNYQYKEIGGIKLISAIFYLARQSGSNAAAKDDNTYDFVQECLSKANLKCGNIPLEINNSSIRHWVKYTFFRPGAKDYIWCNELGNSAKIISPLKIK